MNNVLTYHKSEATNLEKFCEIENITNNDDGVLKEQNKSYGKTSITHQDGKYTATLPWKYDCMELPTNEEVARQRTYTESVKKDSAAKRPSPDPPPLTPDHVKCIFVWPENVVEVNENNCSNFKILYYYYSTSTFKVTFVWPENVVWRLIKIALFNVLLTLL